MTRKKRKRRGSRKIPIAPTAGLIYGLIKPHPWGNQGDWENESMVGKAMKGKVDEVLKDVLSKTTGFKPDGSGFDVSILLDTYGPAIVGALVSKAMDVLGVNRVFSRLPSPLKRLKI